MRSREFGVAAAGCYVVGFVEFEVTVRQEAAAFDSCDWASFAVFGVGYLAEEASVVVVDV